jgi:hypothetical protein
MTIFQCEQMFSELPLKADMRRLRRHVRNVPKTDMHCSCFMWLIAHNNQSSLFSLIAVILQPCAAFALVREAEH